MMSFTETQVIHSRSPTASATFIFTNGIDRIEPDDKGLMMNVDAKLGESMKPGRRSQNCGLSSLSGWILRALQYFQNSHLAFDLFATNVNDIFAKKAHHIVPIFLYMSLLVLGIQGAIIMALLSQSLLPMGMWFLMTCISSMGAIFCFTSEITEFDTLVPFKKG